MYQNIDISFAFSSIRSAADDIAAPSLPSTIIVHHMNMHFSESSRDYFTSNAFVIAKKKAFVFLYSFPSLSSLSPIIHP